MNSTNATAVNATQQLTEQSRRRRLIGADSKPQGASVICVEQYGSVTFSANKDNYPVYLEESIYNTNPNYDYGLLTKLKTKLITANLQISEFMMSFPELDQVYVFGRASATPYCRKLTFGDIYDFDSLDESFLDFPGVAPEDVAGLSY
jgi:hypothetical protein